MQKNGQKWQKIANNCKISEITKYGEKMTKKWQKFTKMYKKCQKRAKNGKKMAKLKNK